MTCQTCKWNYGSYHCRDCYDFKDDVILEKFCSYCNYNYGSDKCQNCVNYDDR